MTDYHLSEIKEMHIKPKSFYMHPTGGLVKPGEDWPFSEYNNLIEVIWLEDDFEYGKGQWMAKEIRRSEN